MDMKCESKVTGFIEEIESRKSSCSRRGPKEGCRWVSVV